MAVKPGRVYVCVPWGLWRLLGAKPVVIYTRAMPSGETTYRPSGMQNAFFTWGWLERVKFSHTIEMLTYPRRAT